LDLKRGEKLLKKSTSELFFMLNDFAWSSDACHKWCSYDTLIISHFSSLHHFWFHGEIN
jgi:hypothetical protein